MNKRQRQKSGYQILEWCSQRTLHSAIHQSRQIYLFDKDCDGKRRRMKGNFAENAIKKMLNS